MATTNLVSTKEGNLVLQTGNGSPDHIATIGTLYMDLNVGIEYINKNGINLWVEQIGSDSVYYELLSNKQNSMAYDGTGTKYPSVDAVNTQANNLARATISTGFVDVNDDFSLYKYDDNTLGISGSSIGIVFKNLFTAPPLAPSEAIVQLSSRLVPLSNIGLTGSGTTVKYVGYRQLDDSIIFSNTTFIKSQTVCQLGVVLVKYSGGTTSFIDNQRTFINQPDISSYNNLEITSSGIKSNVIVANNGNNLRIRNTSGNLIGISVNWHGPNNDLLPIIGSEPTGTTFSYLYPGSAIEPTPPTQGFLIDPSVYWDGAALVSPGNANTATIQRFLVTIRGNIAVQYGETSYANFTTAQNNVSIQSFTDVLPVGTFAEVGRVVLTKSATDLSDNTKAQFFATGGGSGGSSSPAVWGGITGNIFDQTDLITELNGKQELLTNPITGTGTTNTLPKFSSASTLTNSNISDNGSLVTITTDSLINGLTVGKGSGNVSANTALGSNALAGNNVSTNITAIGFDALRFVSGSSNTGIGSQALRNCTTGPNNTALGIQSLLNLTTGTNCIGIGNLALSENVSGSNSIAIGTSAGRFLLNGVSGNTNAIDNIFIGSQTRSFANSQNNQIVIGDGANGIGSHSVVLGNDSVTKTALKGNVIIGQTGTIVDNGVDKLQVSGSVDFKGTTITDLPLLGPELLTTGSGTNWTGTSYSSGYTHITGSTTPLVSIFNAASIANYKITITITGRTAGSISTTLGGYSDGLNSSGNNTKNYRTISTGNLIITPTTDFNGTIFISVMLINAVTPILTLRNSSGILSGAFRYSSGSMYFGVNAGQRASGDNQNTVFGVANCDNILNSTNITSFGSGNLGQLVNDDDITVFGRSVFNLIRSNGAPLRSIGIGINVGASLTTGAYNFLIGNGIAVNATTASNNFGGGYNTFSSLTTGSNNVAIAGGDINAGALMSNTSGSSNIAFGNLSGKFIANGSTLNTITNNSIYIGENTKALADNQTNQIVIGHTATGIGSNSAVLGNDSITKTALKGNILIGTTADTGTHKLQVSGTTLIIGNLTATTFVKSGGTSSQYLMADGSTSLLINNITGTGTSNRIPKFSTSTQLSNSNILDNGTLLTLSSSTVVIGGLSADSLTINNGTVRLKGFTVATLPVGVIGDTAYVTDALAPTYLSTVVGGGSIVVKVFFNGSNWIT